MLHFENDRFCYFCILSPTCMNYKYFLNLLTKKIMCVYVCVLFQNINEGKEMYMIKNYIFAIHFFLKHLPNSNF